MGAIISTIEEKVNRKIKAVNEEIAKGNLKFQLWKPIFKDFGIQFNLKAENIPKEYFECGRLEIKFKIPFTSDFRNLRIRLNSSSFDVTRNWIFEKRITDEIMIEFSLINTDTSWKTTTYKSVFPFQINGSIQDVKISGDLTFGVTVTERKPDIELIGVGELSSEEAAFVERRKKVVFRNMRDNLTNFTIAEADDVPTIAIIGSGGGLRAVIGMSAAMTVLKERHILDYAMYTAGVSGSAWYLLTLFAKDEFNPNTVMENIRRNLHNFNGTKFGMLLRFFKFYGKGHFSYKGSSFTNLFGEMVYRVLLKEECGDTWSACEELLTDGTVPFPLVAALHIRDETKSKEYGEWVEFSPYQVFLPRYGTAIKMKHFGSHFYGGFCTEEYKEKPISFLQGMCGSAYAIGRDYMPSGEKGLTSLKCIKIGIRVLFYLFDNEFVAKVPNFLFGITEFKADEGFHNWDVSVIAPICNILFGNKVIEYKANLVDVQSEHMKLVDAGIAFNSPYPTILRSSRKVDLIISFDFSKRDGDKKSPFEELIKAEKWARQRGILFPLVQVKVKQIEKEIGQQQYKELYIFDQPYGMPTIMHFVLVNNSYRTKAACNDFDIFPAYDTLKFDYTRPEFNQLHYLVRHNVMENVETIHKYIEKVFQYQQTTKKIRRVLHIVGTGLSEGARIHNQKKLVNR